MLSYCTHSLADVLSCEDHVAGPTPEATDVPLLLQGEERLTLLDLVSTPSTVWKGSVRGRGRKMGRKRGRTGEQRSRTEGGNVVEKGRRERTQGKTK